MSKQLARPRPERGPDQDRTRVVFVRQPVKRIARESGRDPLLRYIFISCAITIVVVALLAALGALGSALGFEDTLGLPRRTTDLARSFVQGIATVTTMPSTILRAGEGAILLPLLGFLGVGIPAALLALARPRVPGAPLPRSGVRALASTGGVLACVLAGVCIAWSVLPWRTAIVTGFPDQVAGYPIWRFKVDLVTSIDVFAFIALVLWCVLGFRLGLPRWGRALTCVALLAATATVFVAMSLSSGVVHGLEAQRPQIHVDGALLLGNVGGANLLARVTPEGIQSSLGSGPLEFVGTSSLAVELAQASTAQVDGPRP